MSPFASLRAIRRGANRLSMTGFALFHQPARVFPGDAKGKGHLGGKAESQRKFLMHSPVPIAA